MASGKLWIWAGIVAVVGLGGFAALQSGLGVTGGGSGFETRFMSPADMAADKALVVDIRTPQEWSETGVIPGAKLVTFTDAQSFMTAIGDDLAPGQDLVLICHSGRRSAAAAEALAGLIPNHIISVAGGMAAELGAGIQTVAPQL